MFLRFESRRLEKPNTCSHAQTRLFYPHIVGGQAKTKLEHAKYETRVSLYLYLEALHQRLVRLLGFLGELPGLQPELHALRQLAQHAGPRSIAVGLHLEAGDLRRRGACGNGAV